MNEAKRDQKRQDTTRQDTAKKGRTVMIDRVSVLVSNYLEHSSRCLQQGALQRVGGQQHLLQGVIHKEPCQYERRVEQ